MRFNLER